MYGVDWDYYYQLGLINRTSFLLNYLFDIIDGAQSYFDWINGDLYEWTDEHFDICAFPGVSYFNWPVHSLNIWFVNDTIEALRTHLVIQPYNEHTATGFQIPASDDWLRCQQALALPVLPPTTSEASQYFLTKIREYAALASIASKEKINHELFSQDWNQPVDGKDHYYVTVEVLSAYAKTWEKINDIQASQEIIPDKINLINQSHDIFAGQHLPFPEFLTGSATSVQPWQGMIDIDSAQSIPPSISVELTTSHGISLGPPSPYLPASALTSAGESEHLNPTTDM